MLVNKVAKVVSLIVILMLRSFTVFDVTLNALLYFILDLNDELVWRICPWKICCSMATGVVILGSRQPLEYLPFLMKTIAKAQKIYQHVIFRTRIHRFSTVTLPSFSGLPLDAQGYGLLATLGIRRARTPY
jgi:hypothetical protein